MLSILVCHSYYLRLDHKQVLRAKPYPPLATLQVVAMLREAGQAPESSRPARTSPTPPGLTSMPEQISPWSVKGCPPCLLFCRGSMRVRMPTMPISCAA